MATTLVNHGSAFCSSSIITYLFVFIILTQNALSQTAGDPGLLYCYRCMTLACNTSPEICSAANEFMQNESKKYYYTGNQPLPECPDPENLEEWELLSTKSPSRLRCDEIAKGQATCVLGRFQLNSVVIDSNANITTFGTILGCAKKELLDAIKRTALGKDKKTITSLTTLKECHSEYSRSDVRDSLQHYLRLEHCPRLSDMCYTENYCIHPRYANVRAFQDLGYNTYGVQTTTFVNILIGVAVLIGILIAVLTFAGIKYS